MEVNFDILKIGQLVKMSSPHPLIKGMIEGIVVDVISPTKYKIESQIKLDGYPIKITSFLLTEFSEWERLN